MREVQHGSDLIYIYSDAEPEWFGIGNRQTIDDRLKIVQYYDSNKRVFDGLEIGRKSKQMH